MIFSIILSLPSIGLSDIESEFQLSTSLSRLPQKFEHNSQYEAVQFPISTTGLTATLHPSNLNLQLNNLRYVSDKGLLSVETDQVSASFYSPRISAKGIMKISHANYNLNVNVDAYCDEIKVFQPHARFRLSINENLQVDQVEVDWSNNDWVMEIGSCQAPPGTQDQIRTEFFNYFKNTSYIKDMFQNEFRTQYSKLLIQKVNEFKSLRFSFSDRYEIKMNDHFLVQFQNQNIILRSTFIHVDPDKNIFYNLDFTPIDPTQVTQNNSFTLQIPKKYIESQIQNELIASMQKSSYRLNDNPSFQKLMNSRFLQFFVWSALLDIPKKSEMVIRSAINPNVQLIQQNSKLKMMTSANINSTIFQSHKGITQSFVSFPSTLNSEMTLQLNQQQEITSSTDSVVVQVNSKKIPKTVRKEFQNFATMQIQTNIFKLKIQNDLLTNQELKVKGIQIQDQDLIIDINN